MYQIVNESGFIMEFDRMNRANNFSREGRRALFEYLIQLEEDMAEGIELDVIALCCDYTEYENFQEFQEAYTGFYGTKEDLKGYTTLIKIDDERFIIQNF